MYKYLVPKGNPDHIESSSASHYGEYDIAGVMDLTEATYETAHGGYDPVYANEDSDRVLPVDVLPKRMWDRDSRYDPVRANCHGNRSYCTNMYYLAAGLYAGRSRLSVLIIEKGQDGGQIAITDEIRPRNPRKSSRRM